VTKEPTETEKGLRTYTCTVCESTKTEEIPTLTHTHKYTAVVTEPTCTTDGYTTYTCECGDSYVADEVPASHTSVVDKAVAATCTETGLTEGSHCGVCGTILTIQRVVDPLGHDYEGVVTKPTCTTDGYTTYTCTVCEDSYVDDEVEATGHTWGEGVVTKEPTETEKGLRTYTCTVCESTKTEEIPTLTHTHKYTAVVTEPTCTEDGYTTYTCACGDSYVDDEVEATGHKYVDGVCSVCGEKDPEAVELPFTDVNKDDWFAEAVHWAVAQQITTGYPDGTFGPNDSCTRAQAVTFLWRIAGSPVVEDAEVNFSDVSEDDWFYDAVCWAVSEGITNGYPDGNFGANDLCTRAQIVTFIWRSVDEPKASIDAETFGDVDEDDWYYNAVLWAVGEEITTGYPDGNFGPEDTCTRAQIVTFLYREFAK